MAILFVNHILKLLQKYKIFIRIKTMIC